MTAPTYQEMNDQVRQHKLLIAAALQKLGHTVARVNEGEQAEHWSIGGVVVTLKTTIERPRPGYCGMYTPNGKVRFTIESYPVFKRIFPTKKAGFDYNAIAAACVEAAHAANVRRSEQVTTDSKTRLAHTSAERLMSEFGLRSIYGQLPLPLSIKPGYNSVNLEFTHLTEAQARIIMVAAKAAGALN